MSVGIPLKMFEHKVSSTYTEEGKMNEDAIRQIGQASSRSNTHTFKNINTVGETETNSSK